jgi:hypothetical protein
VVVPHYEGLSVTRSFYDVLRMYPTLHDYFPIYSESYIPGRKYFWQVFGTLFHEDAKRFIDMEREKRYVEEEEQKERVMMINPQILDELENVKYFSKKKGRALFKMSSKAYPPIERKRKRPFSAISDASSPPKRSIKEGRESKRMKMHNSTASGEKMIELPRKRKTMASANKMQTSNDKSAYALSNAPSELNMSAGK